MGNELTEFERAILDHIGRENPDVERALERLSVVRREYTPCGSYTDFEEITPDSPSTRDVGIGLITVPGVKNGMCAILFLRDSHPMFLELVTFGGEDWDGGFDGFEIVDDL